MHRRPELKSHGASYLHVATDTTEFPWEKYLKQVVEVRYNFELEIKKKSS